MLALAVNVDQKGCEPSHLGSRSRLPVYADRAPPVLNFPGNENHPVFGLDIHCTDRLQYARVVRLKDQLRQSGLSGPDQISLGPSAERKPDGINNDRLSGACLSGQDIQPVREIDVHLPDQRQIPDVKVSQHSSHSFMICPSFPRSTSASSGERITAMIVSSPAIHPRSSDQSSESSAAAAAMAMPDTV